MDGNGRSGGAPWRSFMVWASDEVLKWPARERETRTTQCADGVALWHSTQQSLVWESRDCAPAVPRVACAAPYIDSFTRKQLSFLTLKQAKKTGS